MKPSKTLFLVIIVLAIVVVIGMVGLRYLLLDTNPIEVSVLYSTEKEAWLKEVINNFEGQARGRPIEIKLEQLGSREMYLAVLDGEKQPDLISPASSLQIALLQDLSTAKFGTPMVNAADPAACRSVVKTPLVLVAWRERADVLWGDNPNGNMWHRLHDAVVDPAGWKSYGHPEWGYIKFSHTDPLKSNSGLMTILLMTYGYFGKTNGLTADDLLANEAYRQWFAEIENTILDFGSSTGTYMKDIVVYGPSKYDLVAVYEATAIEQAGNAVGRYGELKIYYPPATVLSDHPFCALNAAWVTSEKAEAAQVFVDYLLSRPVQEKALQHGFRPADPTIPLDQPGSPFMQYAANGLKTDLPPEVEIPPGNVLNTLLEVWQRSGQR
ncbi:MAG: substrate-binding domain-containing protein [Anaerolineae bacterium]|nr:substrate-binding domain-containing protein [Anaerolineae bacterium]